MAKSKLSHSTQLANQLAPQTLILDNGAHTIKAGFSSPSSTADADADADTAIPPATRCQLVPNAIARSQRDKLTYVGAELDACADFGELQIRRPVEKGYIVNWESQRAVWERMFNPSARPSAGAGSDAGSSASAKESALRCDPHETNLVLTEALNAPAALARNADEMVFEEFEFAGLWRTEGVRLNAYAASPFASPTNAGALPEYGVPMECLLVVDAGHSHTTITPLYHGRVLQTACRRLEVGGKTLTNYLKDTLGRTMDMHREEWICQEIKEDVCYVVADATEFGRNLEKAWRGGQKDPREIDASIVVDYVLPDYEQLKRGFARPHDPSKGAKMRRLGIGGTSEMVLPIGNERFTVPELLFTPSDIGMQQEGIAGTIMQSLNALPKGLWQAFLANILVVGGTSKLPGFLERLEGDLRSFIDDSYLVRIARANDPLKNAWLGGARLAQNGDMLKSLVVTRQEYLEHGDLWTRRRFAGKVAR